MPARNSRKNYVENNYYHIYNRGVEKRKIFLDKQDHAVFLSYIKEYLLPKDEDQLRRRLMDPNATSWEKDRIIRLLRMNNFTHEITCLAYCLMPNHFHFFVKQKSADSIDRFMNSLGTRYTMYFNKKYKRVGPLYQGVYKAVIVNTEEQFLHLSRYIHKQALALQGEALQEQPSSYFDYLGIRKTEWIKPYEVLAYFSKTNAILSYEAFVNQEESIDMIKEIEIENCF